MRAIMEMDVNLAKPQQSIELKTISAGSYATNNNNNNSNNNHNNNNAFMQQQQQTQNSNYTVTQNRMQQPQVHQQQQQHPAPQQTTTAQRKRTGCCGILSRLLCASGSRAKTASSSNDYNNFDFNLTNAMAVGSSAAAATSAAATMPATTIMTTQPTSQQHRQQQQQQSNYHSTNGAYIINSTYGGHQQQQQKTQNYQQLLQPARKSQTRRTPQEIYFESRGKSCKKLLKFNGNSNKILLYPEEGWARTASSSYWTITPCWWQPNRCRIEEFAGTQRHSTKAKMVSLEQKGSLLIAGHFRSKKNTNANTNSNSNNNNGATNSTTTSGSGMAYKDKDADEFKLHLSSNITMEDYNMGYCLTGFVERRCQQTNTFQMTHFAVIKRQWPSITASSNKST